MTERAPISLGDVEETMLIPLYARAVETRRERGIVNDPLSARMVDAIDYDFSRFDQPPTLYGCVLRASVFDRWVREFLADHPTGTVIEVGAGLNTRFERVDNGSVHWVDLDLPDVIALRRRFFDESDRRRIGAASVLDPAWVSTVRQWPPPYFFAVEAVLMYLVEADVRRALGLIADNFPGARVALDTGGHLMVDRQDRHPTMKFMAAKMRWACDDPREIEGWGLGLRLLASSTSTEVPRDQFRRLPLVYRAALRAMRAFPPTARMYRLNIFEVAPPAG
ncbi:class I SAM-dependent methyltransferase [Plantactinospora sp. WMMC1484]|uniref:class I SAM-dependent methyltransferase n=1 Tax=Plantactinospora sp. WMMC1484 TaxID=3404122 RepID=UPI003BF4757D